MTGQDCQEFDPTDQEIIWHLLGKVEGGDRNSHPFMDEFIPTVDEDDGICDTHPQNLPGIQIIAFMAEYERILGAEIVEEITKIKNMKEKQWRRKREEEECGTHS
ncbi:hypothetical protein KY285_030397 [Solanum tuberosum]|nr:hypothetical protein KY289_030516 [Solanum tuberosum]KAH0655515.1 hypothetical protein KY285_030397 [Solanum tuberosum]